MLEKWTGLTQDNKVKLIIVVLGAVFGVPGYHASSKRNQNPVIDASGTEKPTIHARQSQGRRNCLT